MPPKPILTLDIDGVVAGGRYLPEWDRTPSIYAALPIFDTYTRQAIQEIAPHVHLYYVSSRPMTLMDTTLAWLEREIGEMGRGVLLGISPFYKPEVLTHIHTDLHVDDNPSIVWPLGKRGVWMINDEWPNAPTAHKELYKASRWEELEWILWRRLVRGKEPRSYGEGLQMRLEFDDPWDEIKEEPVEEFDDY